MASVAEQTTVISTTFTRNGQNHHLQIVKNPLQLQKLKQVQKYFNSSNCFGGAA